EWSGPSEITVLSPSTPYTYALGRDTSNPKVQSVKWELVSSTSAVVKSGTVSNPTDREIEFTVDYAGLSNGTYTLKAHIIYGQYN
ncbi:MAG: hypothetical protein N2442_06840, partial [Spirochaetes bacterium]|nr:hypothetical protein [Spirochaetota bacterium]